MRRLKQACSHAGVAIALAANSEEMSLPAQFHGTGRACFGDLTIQRKTITWNTPFSQCRAASYCLTGHTDNAGQIRYACLLHKTDSVCRYRVISLTHARAKRAEFGWEVAGYGNEGSYRADEASGYNNSAPDMMSCYLVRSPAREGRFGREGHQ